MVDVKTCPAFDASQVFDQIKEQWQQWAKDNGFTKFVVGISGGVDSACVAALAAGIFGKENVTGVTLPRDGNQDIIESDAIINLLGINRVSIDIGDAFASLTNGIENNGITPSSVCKINMPARLRMVALYGVAQSIGACVLNTCNRSESVVGNDTLWGDDCGSYAPIQSLTKGEVIKLASYIGIPDWLALKPPTDGLQPLTDEQRLGVTYNEIDAFIRDPSTIETGTYAKILEMYNKNKFKLEMVHIEGPKLLNLKDCTNDKSFDADYKPVWSLT